MNRFYFGLSTTAFCLFSFSALAGPSDWTCIDTVDGEKIEAHIHSTPNGDATVGGDIFTSELKYGGQELPLLGNKCFVSTKPGERFVKCTHQGNGIRIELYPVVETVSGKIKSMQVIVWHGDVPTQGPVGGCN